jgi:hypothetical protein
VFVGLVVVCLGDVVFLTHCVVNHSSVGFDILTYAPTPIARTAIAPSRIVVFLFIVKKRVKKSSNILKRNI